MSSIWDLKTRADRRTRWRGPRYLLATAILAMSAALVPALRTARENPAGSTSSFILVAIPDLPDPMFQQTVILMLPPTQPPLVAGIIINRPTTIPLLKLFSRAPALKNQETAYFGGPVEVTEPSLILRASAPAANMTRLFDDVYVSTDPDSIVKMLKNDSAPVNNLRVFFGRAQWTADQLHDEISGGAWYVVPARADLVFSPDPGQVWHDLIEHAQLHAVGVTGAQSPGVCKESFCAGESPFAWLLAGT